MRNPRFLKFLFLVSLLTALVGCASNNNRPANPTTQAPAQPETPQSSATLFEQRLLRILDRQEAFENWLNSRESEGNERLAWARFQEVASAYDSLLADNPENLDAHILYGKFLSRNGDAEGAFEQFTSAYRLDPNIAVTNQELGTLYAEQGEITKALAMYLRAIELQPNEAVYHLALGELLAAFRSGLLKENVFDAETIDEGLLEAFRQAAKLRPKDLRIQFRYGEAFNQVGSPDWQMALEFWNDLQKMPGLSTVQIDMIRINRARCLGEMKRYGEARTILMQVASPELAENRRTLMEALINAEGRRQ